jgi:hypothetical protein
LHTPKSNDTFSLLNQLLVEILELKVTLLKWDSQLKENHGGHIC